MTSSFDYHPDEDDDDYDLDGPEPGLWPLYLAVALIALSLWGGWL